MFLVKFWGCFLEGIDKKKRNFTFCMSFDHSEWYFSVFRNAYISNPGCRVMSRIFYYHTRLGRVTMNSQYLKHKENPCSKCLLSLNEFEPKLASPEHRQ